MKTSSVGGRDRWWSTALVAWTLFVWGNRVWNIASGAAADEALGYVGRALPVLFLALAVLAVVGALVGASSRGPRLWQLAVRALAVATIAIWPIRTIGILVGDHSIGFVVVHLILAAVSIALAVLALRAVTPRVGGSSVQSRPDTLSVNG